MKTKSMRKIVTGIFIIALLGAFGFAVFQVFGSLAASASNYNDPPVTDPTEYSNTQSAALVWQALWVTPQQGQPYWTTAPQPFSLASILGSDGVDFSTVASMQNNIYMKLDEPAGSWSFSAQETIAVRDSNGDIAAIIVDAKTINANGQSAPSGQNLWVAGATVTGEQLQTLINLPQGDYTITISLQNINLSVDNMQLSAAAGTEQQLLSWPIKIN